MKTQRLVISQAMLRVAPNVTADDRNACAKKFKVSKQTICYYLNGKVTNNDKALVMLEFFKQRIHNRQLEIKQLCQ